MFEKTPRFSANLDAEACFPECVLPQATTAASISQAHLYFSKIVSWQLQTPSWTSVGICAPFESHDPPRLYQVEHCLAKSETRTLVRCSAKTQKTRQRTEPCQAFHVDLDLPVVSDTHTNERQIPLYYLYSKMFFSFLQQGDNATNLFQGVQLEKGSGTAKLTHTQQRVPLI